MRRGDAVRRVGAAVPHESVRTGAPHADAAAFDAGGGAWADRRHLEPGRHPGHAVDQRLLGGQRGARALGRSARGGDRAVRPRRHDPRGRDVRHGHPHRADPSPWRPERAIRHALCRDRSHRPLDDALQERARAFRPTARRGPRRAGAVRPARGWAWTPACCCSAVASCPAGSFITWWDWRWLLPRSWRPEGDQHAAIRRSRGLRELRRRRGRRRPGPVHRDGPQRRKEPVQRLDMSGMPHEASKPVFMVYRYDEIAQVLRDHETFSSGIIISVFGDVFGQARHARNGRARASPLPLAGLQGVHAAGARAPARKSWSNGWATS